MAREKRRLVVNNEESFWLVIVDNEESYWIVDGRRLSEKEANDLQVKLDKKYFKISNKDKVPDS